MRCELYIRIADNMYTYRTYIVFYYLFSNESETQLLKIPFNPVKVLDFERSEKTFLFIL